MGVLIINKQTAIRAQVNELISAFPGLYVQSWDEKSIIIQGMLDFSATYNDVRIDNIFDIELLIPVSFPQDLPIAWEIGGCIPKDFHRMDDGSLCLGAMLAIRIKLSQNPTLKGFVEDQLVPYLYSFCYSQEYGQMPYGELSHGSEGIYEFYCGLLNTDSESYVCGFLNILAGNYRGHHPCPCGSGDKLRNCHGNFIQELSTQQSKDSFIYDYKQCLRYLVNKTRNRTKKLY